ncbi:MAG TPA: hypothetical protein VD902_03475 [Symbiobacteriaceae bacterium]|nr:hypothetical protein [Symbiobacteriaceae bacterium]
MSRDNKTLTQPQVIIRHHHPELPDTESLQVARELWAAGLIRQFRRERVQEVPGQGQD